MPAVRHRPAPQAWAAWRPGYPLYCALEHATTDLTEPPWATPLPFGGAIAVPAAAPHPDAPMETSPSQPMNEPVAPDETICWPVPAHYLAVPYPWRGPADFSVIPTLLHLLARERTAPVAVQDAVWHLEDAADDALPRPLRTRHLFLAGVLVWAAMDGAGATDALTAFLDLWRAAGGG